MNKLRVSVIIPTYNRKQYLGPAIESVLAQTMNDLEIIVVDDGSTDGTAEFVRQTYGDRVQMIRIPHSGLPAAGRNAGIQASRAELIAFLDSDDLWLPHKLERQVQAAEQDAASALFYGMEETFQNADMKQLPVHGQDGRSGRVFKQLLVKNFVPSITVVVRRDALTRLGGFDSRPEYRAIEDYDLWLRIAYHYPIHFTRDILARYRVHDANISHGLMPRIDRWEMMLRNFFAAYAVRPALRQRVLAQLDIERFKYTLRTRQDSLEVRGYLQRALQTDPWNVPARLLYSVTRFGGEQALRLLLLNYRKELKVNS